MNTEDPGGVLRGSLVSEWPRNRTGTGNGNSKLSFQKPKEEPAPLEPFSGTETGQETKHVKIGHVEIDRAHFLAHFHVHRHISREHCRGSLRGDPVVRLTQRSSELTEQNTRTARTVSCTNRNRTEPNRGHPVFWF